MTDIERRAGGGVRVLPPEALREFVAAYPFPDPENATADGLLAYGGDLLPERLLSAYAQGVFPWYDEPPILWFSPDPRVIIPPGGLRVNRSLRRSLRRRVYEIRMDTDFEGVIDACASVTRPGQEGTWITTEMRAAYCELHRLGFAHCCEAWEGGELVGGIYGVSLGRAFFGESMFAQRSDASKVALFHLMRQIESWGFAFLDCQAPNEHTTKLGAVPLPRAEFLARLAAALETPTRVGPWRLEQVVV